MTHSRIGRGGWLLLVTLVLSTAAWLPLVFLPGKKAIADLRGELRAMQDFVTSSAHCAPLIESTIHELKNARRYNERWRVRDGSSASMAGLFSEIAQLIQHSGASTTRFAPDPPTAYDHLGRVSLSLACEGSFDQVRSVVDSLEAIDERLWIDRLQWESPDNGQTVKCELMLVLFADYSALSD